MGASLSFVFPIVIFAIFFVQLFLVYPLPANFEDSFITYRYIESISNLHFFAWNFDGNPVYGMTGLIFPALAGLLNMLIDNPIISATILGSVASLLFLSILIYRTFENKDKYLIILLVVLNSIFLLGTTNGLETSLVFLILAIVFSINNIQEKPIIASLLSILAFLARPDLILIVGVFFFIQFMQHRHLKSFFIYIGFSFFLLVGLLIFLNHMFGTPLPLSWYIKGGGIGIWEYPRWILSQYVIFPFLRVLPLLLILVFILFGLGESALNRKNQLTSVFQGVNLKYFSAASIYYLYQLTTLPIMNVGFRFFAPLLVLVIFWLLDQKDLTLVFKKIGFKVLLTISIIISGYFTYQDILQSRYSVNDHDEFATMGKRLASINKITIASSEAGKLAFYSGKNHFFDTIGLNNYFVAKNYKKSDYGLLLGEYFDSTSWPDVYIRALSGIEAGEYSYLENTHGFLQHYRCYRNKNLKVCIKNGSVDNIYPILFSGTTPTELMD